MRCIVSPVTTSKRAAAADWIIGKELETFAAVLETVFFLEEEEPGVSGAVSG
jgi:hypothetical protein